MENNSFVVFKTEKIIKTPHGEIEIQKPVWNQYDRLRDKKKQLDEKYEPKK